LAGLIGFGSFASKFVCGWLADRFSSGLIPFVAFCLPGIGYGLVEFGRDHDLLIALAVLCVGLGSGGSIHMTNYLLSRHVGLASFGKVFGFIASGMSVGSAIGPVLAGHIFDVTGSYSLLLLAGMPLALTAGLLVAFLGPYPDFSRRDPA
ncbi:MAG TPA: MFS transporter, partial [Novosphingobium sp.]|nr:MFS transporter [Novosphingobium sp.]